MLTQELTYTDAPNAISSLQGLVQQFQKYDFIYLDHARSQRLFYVRSGLVRLGAFTEDDKEITYCLLQEGALFGNFSFQMQEGRPFAQAYSTSEVATFSELELKSLFQKNTTAAFELFQLMGDHIRTMEEQFKMLAYCDVPQRIMRFILYLADMYGYRHQRVTYVPHSFTHEDISAVLHTSRQTVTVTLRELQSQGYLSYSRGEFRIYRYEDLLNMGSMNGD